MQIETNPQTLLASVQPYSTHLGKKPDETQKAAGAAASDPTREDSVRISPEARAMASGLDPSERAVVREMQARDTEVRSHENAHAGAGGAFAAVATTEPKVALREDVATERAEENEVAVDSFIDRRVATYGQVPAAVTDARSMLSLFG